MRQPKTLKIIIKVILGAIAISLFLFIVTLKANYVAPILMYHSINPQPVAGKMLTVSPETFERQMHFLKSQRYNVLRLEELAALIKDKKKVPPRSLAITFDDGYKDNFLYAFTILKKYALPATMFIIIDEVGRPQNDRLSWDDIKIMRDSGLIVFGSHTLGPEPLVNIKSDEELKRQVYESKKILEEKLGRSVTLFSYPEGRFNAKIKNMVIAAGYKAAVATNPGKTFPNDDVFALKRLRISENAKNMFVFWFETSGFYNFLREHRHK